jgi:hypothetical protein
MGITMKTIEEGYGCPPRKGFTAVVHITGGCVNHSAWVGGSE